MSALFEGLENDYEQTESSLEKDTLEQVEELEKLKEQYMTEELDRLLAIGDKNLIDNAIDTTENTDKLLNWREQLLEAGTENDPNVKKLVLR